MRIASYVSRQIAGFNEILSWCLLFICVFFALPKICLMYQIILYVKLITSNIFSLSHDQQVPFKSLSCFESCRSFSLLCQTHISLLPMKPDWITRASIRVWAEKVEKGSDVTSWAVSLLWFCQTKVIRLVTQIHTFAGRYYATVTSVWISHHYNTTTSSGVQSGSDLRCLSWSSSS